MSTFIGICQAVRAQAGISGEGPTSVTGQSGIYADVVRWVEESYNEIQTLYENWNFLYTPVSFTLQQGFQSFPALANDNIRQIAKDSFLRQFQLGDKERLKFQPWHEFKNTDKYLSADTGVPEIVTELPNGDLHFYPIPDDDYDIHYEGYRRPYMMTNGLDAPIFAAQYHDLIKLLALMKYGEYYNSSEVYKSAEKNYNKMIKKMEFSELPKNNIVLRPLVRFA